MSTHHEGVGCDACQNNNFKGKRFKCLICFDYDLCSDCYDKKAVSGIHLNTHPMQCLLTSSDISIYYSGESVGKQCCSYTCPLCGLKGFTEETMSSHVNENHAEDYTEVICPICVSVPGIEPNQMVEFFANHMNSNIHQNCDDNNAVRIRQRIRGTSNNRNRRPQFSSNVTNAAGSGGSSGVGGSSGPSGSGNGVGSSNSRENQLGSVAQLLTQFSDSRFVRSYAPGQQTVTSTTSSRQQGSSNCDRFMIPKWGQMRMDDVLWEGRKNESLTSRALHKKDDTPWLRNPPPNLIDEPGEEVSIFEMDRSVFVIQLLLSTLSIEVPLHGTDPVPQRQLFEDSENEITNEQTNKNQTAKKSQNITENTGKSNHSSSTKMNRRNVVINDGINRNTVDNVVVDDDDDDEDDDDDDYGKKNESGEELSDKDDNDNDSRTIQNSNCDGLKRRTHRNNNKNNNTKPYLRLNSAPPTSGSGGGGGNVGAPNGQKTGLSAHNTTKPLLPTSSGNVNSLSQARASKVRSASLNSGTSLSSLTTTMRSTLGPMNPAGAMNVVSPTGRRRNFTSNQNNISSVGGVGGGTGGGSGANGGNAQQRQQQHPESSSN